MASPNTDNTITITNGSDSITVTPVPGSVKAGGGHDDRGGGAIPPARAGKAANGSCQVVVTNATATNLQHTVGELISVIFHEGAGAATVAGAGKYANISSSEALIDVTIEGDSVQLATISWKGTAA